MSCLAWPSPVCHRLWIFGESTVRVQISLGLCLSLSDFQTNKFAIFKIQCLVNINVQHQLRKFHPQGLPIICGDSITILLLQQPQPTITHSPTDAGFYSTLQLMSCMVIPISKFSSKGI